MQRAGEHDSMLSAALLVGGLIAAYWLFTKFRAGVNVAVDTIAAPLATAYVGLTSGAAQVPQGSAVFPDGSYVPMSQLSPKWYGSALVFSYKGGNWQLQSQVNGNYPAIPYVGA